MKGGVIILALVVLLSSFISADITFTQEIKPVYNLGDTISVPVTVKATSDISEMLDMYLVCGNETYLNFYKNGINLVSGEEKNIEASLVLIRSVVGSSNGTCRIKATIPGMAYEFSNSFKVSIWLNVEANFEKLGLNAGGNITITGKITKETGEKSNGFVEVSIITANEKQNIIQQGTVKDGIFSVSLALPSDLKAGNHLIKVTGIEKNNDGLITNTGFSSYNISVRQVPKNLEIIMETSEVIPGTPLKVRAILHDQTGEKIDSTAIITIKNFEGKIMEEKEIRIDEIFEYPIKSNEFSAEWEILVSSNSLDSEKKFFIEENEEIDIEIGDKSILITNIGNVPYDKTLLVEVGGSVLSINVMLDVGESKKYAVVAPNGEYDVKVSGDGKEVSDFMSLTGGAVNIREIENFFGMVLWILIIIVIVICIIVFRKVYKKRVSKNITSKNKKTGSKNMEIISVSDAARGNKAEISLSIKGEKQDANVICLRIRDLREMKSRRGSASETIQKIVDLAESNKAVTYENQDYLFFILAPTKTRTFKNEKTALELAERIDGLLEEHNKMFNQKMDFGISLNYGTIVGKLENGIFKFMSMGTLITAAKKIASLSKREVLLSDKMNDLLRLNIRTEKQIREGVPVFIIKEVKRENEEAKKFIDRFLKRQEK